MIAVVCFIFFVNGLSIRFGSYIRYCLSFAVPFLYMTFGFTTLGESNEQSSVIKRSLIRNLVVFGVSTFVFSIASLIYIKMNDLELMFTFRSVFDFLVLGEWQLPIGDYIWFVEEMCVALIFFLILSKTGLLRSRIVQIALIIVTLAANVIHGEFATLFDVESLTGTFFCQAIPFMLIGKLIRDTEDQVYDLGPVISIVTVVIGMLSTIAEMKIANHFAHFDYRCNFVGSIVVAVAVLMLAVQIFDLGENTQFAFWAGGCAPWVFLLAHPVKVLLSDITTSVGRIFSKLESFIIFVISLILALILTLIINLLAPSAPVIDPESGELLEEEDENIFTE